MHFNKRREGDEYFIDAFHGWKPLGNLLYEIDSPDTVYLSEIYVPNVKNRRQGVASALIKEFVRDIGTRKNVYAYVANRPSYEAMRRMGMMDRISREKGLTLIGPLDLFKQIPIASVMMNGGITMKSLEFSFRHDLEEPTTDPFYLYSFTLKGST